MRHVLALALVVLGQAPTRWKANVGMPVSVNDIVLPGSELEAVPAERTSPLVLRVDAVRAHGGMFRYDFVFYALEPGLHDLRSVLRRRDGTGVDDLAPLAFEVASLLPPGQVEPHRPKAGDVPRLGGYQMLLWILGGAWVLGLVLFARAGRRRRLRAVSSARQAMPLEETLRPLVAAARAGTLAPGGRAELERALIELWRRRVAPHESEAEVVLTKLASHAEAGPLLAGLEQWLHRPGAPPVDLERLLAPYENLTPSPPPRAAGQNRTN